MGVMQADVPPTPARRNSKANAEATRRAALHLFVQHGFEATSMREIARRVGVSAATVYNYTDSKESLLWDLVRQVRDGLDGARSEAVARSACPVEVIRFSLVAMARYHLEHPRECQVVEASSAALSAARASELEAAQAQELAFFESLIGAAWHDDAVDAADLRVTARMLIQATKLGATTPAGEPLDGDDELPERVARFGLRALGVRSDEHQRSCTAPAHCTVADVSAG